MNEKDNIMPVEAIPFLIAFGLFFGAFVVVVGGVSLWCALAPAGKKEPRS